MRMSKKTVIAIIACVATVCVAGCLWVSVVGGQRNEIARVDGLIAEKESALVKANSKDDDGSAAVLAKRSSIHGEVGRYVVTREQASDLGVDINRIAKQVGVHEFSSTNRMKSSYGTINECEYVVEGRMQLEFTGTFFQFAEFVNQLERFEPVMFVDKFEIKRDKSNDGLHAASIVVAFFVAQGELDKVMSEVAESGAVAENIVLK
jgi:hypothetical protein